LALAERLGDLVGQAQDHTNVGELLICKGETAGAVEHLSTAVSLCARAGGALALEGFARMLLAKALRLQGTLDAAIDELDRSTDLLRTAGIPALSAEASLELAALQLDRGDPAAAEATCSAVLAHLDDWGMKALEVRGRRIMGRIALAQGDTAEAQRLLRSSADLAARLGADRDQGLALLALAQLCGGSGANRPADRSRASKAAAQACELLETSGAAADLARAKQVRRSLTGDVPSA
jgi:tetratricopeptide (TPR) repeat protein